MNLILVEGRMSPQDVVAKETLWQSIAAARQRERFCLLLTTDDKLVLELRHPNKIPTFVEISEFPRSLAEAVQGIRADDFQTFSFQLPDENSILIGKLQGESHHEAERILFRWGSPHGAIYVYPAELTQLLEEIRRHFPES